MQAKVMVTERNFTKISCLSFKLGFFLLCNVICLLIFPRQQSSGYNGKQEHLICLLGFVLWCPGLYWEAQEWQQCSVSNLTQTFCTFLSHQGSYPAEAWGGLVLFYQWCQSYWDWGCSQPFTLGQCCAVNEPQCPKCCAIPLGSQGCSWHWGALSSDSLWELWPLLALVSMGWITSPGCPGIWSQTQVRWHVFDPPQCRGWELLIWRVDVVHTRSLSNVFPLNITWFLYFTFPSSQ